MTASEPYVVAVGPVCVDEYYRADDWPALGNKGMVRAAGTTVGGMIPNAACVFAGYGVRTYLFDILNRSPQTPRMLEDLASYGVDTSAVMYDESVPDPKCIIVVTPGDRTILVVDSQKPSVAVEGERLELFRGAACLYTTVTEFGKFEGSLALADDLKAHGVKLVFDIETTTHAPGFDPLMRKGSVLFFNQHGFERYRGGAERGDYCRGLFADGVETIVVTLGKDGCWVGTPGEEVAVAGISVPVVDATGAGDTFNSSFVRCRMAGLGLLEAARFANAAAAWSVTRMGPKGGVNTVAGVEKLVGKYYG